MRDAPPAERVGLSHAALRVALSPLTRAALGGLLLATGGPPFPPAFIAAAFLGVVLLASSLREANVRNGIARGLAFGFAANLVAMSFVPATITRFTDLPLAAALLALVLLALGQGAVFAVCGAVTALLSSLRVRAPFPIAFGFGIGLSMLVPALFPWTVAAPLARAPVFLQLAEIVGERGVAVVFAIVGALVAGAFARERIERKMPLIGAGAILAALLAYGLLRMPMIDRARAAAPSRVMALVQQAVAPKERWDPDRAPAIVGRLWALTRTAERRGADIAVWPEAAYPYVLPHAPGLEVAPFRIKGPQIGIEIVTGLLTEAPPPPDSEKASRWHYNATALVDRDGRVSQPTAKMELLAFGEAVPLGEYLPALRRVFSRGGGLVAGREAVLLVTTSQPEMRMGVLNCYEDTLGSVARKVMKASPNLLVNVTNDAWFGATAEPELHLLESIPRAIEARRDLVRAVNTGVTAHIDANGRVVSRAEREVQTVLLVEPRLLEIAPTPYLRFGDGSWMAALLAAATISYALSLRAASRLR